MNRKDTMIKKAKLIEAMAVDLADTVCRGCKVITV